MARIIPIAEIQDRQDELALTNTFVKNVVLGHIEMHAYDSEADREALKAKNWCYECEADRMIGLRVNNAVFVE